MFIGRAGPMDPPFGSDGVPRLRDRRALPIGTTITFSKEKDTARIRGETESPGYSVIPGQFLVIRNEFDE